MSLDQSPLNDQPLAVSLKVSKSTRSKDKEQIKYDPDQFKKNEKLLDKYHQSSNRYTNLIVKPDPEPSYRKQYPPTEAGNFNSGRPDASYVACVQDPSGTQHYKKASDLSSMVKHQAIGSFADTDIDKIEREGPHHSRNFQRNSSTSFVPSMTPIFNENSEASRSPGAISPTQQKANPEPSHRHMEEELTLNKQNKFLENVQNMKQLSNLDIFASMETEMKQTMDMFARERKTKKKELSRLKQVVSDQQTQMDAAGAHFKQEKEGIMAKWQKDSKQHQQFYEFITRKMNDTEA